MTAPCPKCGRPLQEVRIDGTGLVDPRRYLCPWAIGEQAWDAVGRFHYMPAGAIHGAVCYWQAGELRGTLRPVDEYERLGAA